MSWQPERDLIGYGPQPPDPQWPHGARIAVNFVLNYEEGAEYCVLDGDARPETLLSELSGGEAIAGMRDLNMESIYEYGSRVGVWRILEQLDTRALPFTVYAVGLALEKNPEVAGAIRAAGCDVVCHGWRWIDYAGIEEHEEREHIRRCAESIERLTGERPVGWYTGRPSINTRRLVVEHGGFIYDSDAYNDDLPYWVIVQGRPHLVICHALDTNDSRFSRGQGFDTADDWFDYMRDAFDWLYREGEHRPRLMTVAVHCRLIGRPGRMAALARFLDHVQSHSDVWICRRREVAEHWLRHHPHGG